MAPQRSSTGMVYLPKVAFHLLSYLASEEIQATLSRAHMPLALSGNTPRTQVRAGRDAHEPCYSTNKIQSIADAHPITHHINLHDEAQTLLSLLVIHREIIDNYTQGTTKDQSIHCMGRENLTFNERKSVMMGGTKKKMLEVMDQQN